MEKLDRIVDVKEREKNKKEIHVIYHLKPEYSENVVVIQPIMSAEEGNFSDDLLEKYPITNNIFGEIYRCNIIDNFLVSSKKLPVVCISITFEKNVLRSYLYKLFLQFTITDNIKNAKQLIKNRIRGKFTIEIIGDTHITILDEPNMEIENSVKKIISKMKDLTKLPEMIEIANNVVKERIQEKFGNQPNYEEILERIKKN